MRKMATMGKGSVAIGESAACGVACSFGAMRVGVLLERMGLHLRTQRFLARLRGDRLWEVSCDYAALAVERLGARLRPEIFAAELFPVERPSRSVVCRSHRVRAARRATVRGRSPRLKTRATRGRAARLRARGRR